MSLLRKIVNPNCGLHKIAMQVTYRGLPTPEFEVGDYP